MKRINDITASLGTLYIPKSALVFYETKGANKDVYVEHFDMDKNGCPVNAHPLTEREGKALARALNTDGAKSKEFLKPAGILPTNVLYINPSEKGSLIWFTKTRKTHLFFVENLGITNGVAEIPAMLWYADKQTLKIFALASGRRPTTRTVLYYAPFFNVYEDGNVCMGTVDVSIKKSASVEEFIQAWESYFFNSYFSHLMHGHNPINGNCVSLWKDLISNRKPFPKEVLKKNKMTFKNLLQ